MSTLSTSIALDFMLVVVVFVWICFVVVVIVVSVDNFFGKFCVCTDMIFYSFIGTVLVGIIVGTMVLLLLHSPICDGELSSG